MGELYLSFPLHCVTVLRIERFFPVQVNIGISVNAERLLLREQSRIIAYRDLCVVCEVECIDGHSFPSRILIWESSSSTIF